MPTDRDLLAVHMEEFKVMHGQILERSKIRQQLLQVGTLLSVAVLGFFGSNIIEPDFFSNYSLSFCLFLLLVPFPFYSLAVYYGHMDYMIGITARYIHSELRPRVARVVRSDEFWRNEDFFEKGRAVSGRTIKEWFGTFGMLLFIPTVLNGLGLLYLTEHWSRIPHSVQKAILGWSVVNLSLYMISIKESFAGVDVLKRITHGDKGKADKASTDIN
ncbi:MAG: hypothetical protein HY645_14880 [Acidobacteria bacterium]|nr:hypothetical protein [Acidobacteriota bacterium]